MTSVGLILCVGAVCCAICAALVPALVFVGVAAAWELFIAGYVGT